MGSNELVVNDKWAKSSFACPENSRGNARGISLSLSYHGHEHADHFVSQHRGVDQHTLQQPL